VILPTPPTKSETNFLNRLNVVVVVEPKAPRDLVHIMKPSEEFTSD
jgi:hypothetical protein